MSDQLDEKLDTGAMPMTEPHPAPIFDTGPHPEPLQSYESDALDFTPLLDSAPRPRVFADEDLLADLNLIAEPVAVPVVVPATLGSVRRWKFALLLSGVWLVAAAAGAGFYYWWFQTVDKTWVEAAVGLFVIVCTVIALLVSMSERPLLSVLSTALMSAPFAAACGAGLLYGAFAYGLISP